jgi:Dolichyl-phosphate-mannose-protein mannosyltransferase
MQGMTEAPTRVGELAAVPAAQTHEELVPAAVDARDARAARGHVVATVLVELAVAVVLLVASAELRGDALIGVTVATAAVLVLVRAGLGAWLAGSMGAAAWGALAILQAAVLVPGFGDPDQAPVVAALTGVGAVAFAAGLAPTLALRGLYAGRRDHVTSGVLAVAVAGGLGVLAAIALADLVPVDDPRLDILVPYVAAGMAVLALAEVLAHHRTAAGHAATPAVVGAAAVAAQVLLLVDAHDAPLDTAVIALTVAGGLATVGLFVATATSTPRPLAVPVEEADGGPRLVAWVLAVLVAVAVAIRVAVVRPLWLDEAVVAQATDGSLADTLAAARHADAHPPLIEVLTWATRQVVGADDLSFRIPSIAAGVALVPVVYMTATRLFDRRAGVIAAVVAAVGPGLLWMSQGVRPGMVAALLATLALLAMLRAVDRGRPVDWLLFGLTGSVLVWSHQLAFLHAGVLLAAAAGVVWRRWRDRREWIGDAAGWAGASALIGGAFVGLVAWRGGLGPPTVLPPLEYATSGAPGAGRSVLGLVGTAVTAVAGFHPQDVTSRLLALWPLGILATFALTVRRWSARGMLLVALAAVPFVALLAVQVAGAPRSPLFALDWSATAVPMLAIGLGRAVSVAGPWPRARVIGAVAAAALAVAAADQAVRVQPIERVDVAPAVEDVATEARRGDLVIYAPATLGGLVRHEVEDADVAGLSDAQARVAEAEGRVLVVGAFGLADDETRDRILALVEEISASRPLAAEVRHGDTTTWSFG